MLQGPEARFSSEGLGRYGRYRVERLIGSGSAGAVFLGRDPILGRPVAIKVVPLRTSRSAEERAERMELLRRAFGPLSSLAHQNLVTVHDVGIEEEHSFLVMEYVPGRDLASHLADGLLAPEQVSSLAMQLARALDFAHGHDFTHGDLKPTNVIVTPGWEVKLTDLGVASALSASGLGHANSRWDDPEHLAPEVAEGESPSPASDRFALGVLLYSLLAGRPPFQGDDATATLWRIANEQPPLPSDLAPELPIAVDGVLLRALAKKPRERFSTCTELAEALRAALAQADEPGPAVYATQPLDDNLRRQLRIAGALTRPVPSAHGGLDPATPATTSPVRAEPTEAAAERSRRRRWPWAAAALLAVGLAAAGVWLGTGWRDRGGAVEGTPGDAGSQGFSWDSSTPPRPGSDARRPPAPPVVEQVEGEPDASRAIVAGAPEALEAPAEGVLVPEAAGPVVPEPAAESGGAAEALSAEPSAAPSTETRAAAADREATMRIRLASEVPTGDVTVWAEERVLLERRFHFGGPLQRLRRDAPRGGQWEETVSLEPGLTFFRVRVTLPSGTMEEIPLRRTLRAGEEAILEIRISPRREISAQLH